jgi:hypothetical protein
MNRPKRLSAAAAIAVIALLAGVGLGGVSQAKKHGGGGKKGVAIKSKTVNAAIPDRATGPGVQQWGTLRSVIELPKKYKGLTVGDVNVTLQTVGSAPDSAPQMVGRLTAPNGDTTTLFLDLAGQNVGPLTLDDESRLTLCHEFTLPCADPDAIINPPYVGKAAPDGWLGDLNGGKMRGDWTLSMFVTDGAPTGVTNTLVSWKLTVTAAKNVRVPT